MSVKQKCHQNKEFQSNDKICWNSVICKGASWFTYGQFHQHFMHGLYHMKVLYATSLHLYFYGAKILAQKLLLKCWWNWHRITKPASDLAYSRNVFFIMSHFLSFWTQNEDEIKMFGSQLGIGLVRENWYSTKNLKQNLHIGCSMIWA
jgi:hypothetical protein